MKILDCTIRSGVVRRIDGAGMVRSTDVLTTQPGRVLVDVQIGEGRQPSVLMRRCVPVDNSVDRTLDSESGDSSVVFAIIRGEVLRLIHCCDHMIPIPAGVAQLFPSIILSFRAPIPYH